ncbi:hypothetical protein MTR67_039218 [Solanum verrucosum]|uniref:Uncharacterized protein n=1 Tax=Solanum verrucosum TaxID=315347 RepID=A0AAF0UGJ8_SOLVR|nr:hypothetical protein MTR67_039218 [Solanum verrucosum]
MMAHDNREVVFPMNPNVGVHDHESDAGGKGGVGRISTYGCCTNFVQPMERRRPVDVGHLVWEKFKVAFPDRLFPLEIREAKVV